MEILPENELYIAHMANIAHGSIGRSAFVSWLNRIGVKRA